MAAHVKSKHHHIDPADGAEGETFVDESHEILPWLEPGPRAGDWVQIEDEDGQIAYIRHLENQGWAEAEGHRRWEEDRGVVQFADAYAQALGYIDAEHRREKETA